MPCSLPSGGVVTSRTHRSFSVAGAGRINEVIDYVDGLFLCHGTARALDFGCGVGRLAFALADYFD